MEANFFNVIHNWFYNQHLLQVSMIVGSDLRPRLQIIKDLAKTHLELFDRPDGLRPNQNITYLCYVQNLQREKRKLGETFSVTNHHCIQLEKEASLFFTRAMAYIQIQQFKLAEKDLLFVLSCLGFVIKKSRKPEIKKYFKRYFDISVLIYQKTQSILSMQQGEIERVELFDTMAQNTLKRLFEDAQKEAPYIEEADLRSIHFFVHGKQAKTSPDVKEHRLLDLQPPEIVKPAKGVYKRAVQEEVA